MLDSVRAGLIDGSPSGTGFVPSFWIASGTLPSAGSTCVALPARVVAGHPFDVADLHPEGRAHLLGVHTAGERLVHGFVPQDEVLGRGLRHLPDEGVGRPGTGDGLHGGVDERALLPGTT